MDLILFIGIFIVALVIIQALIMVIRSRFTPEVQRLKQEIDALSGARMGGLGVDIVKKRTLSEIPWLNELLQNIKVPTIGHLERFREQADVKQPLGFFFLLAAALFAGSFSLVYLTSRSVIAAIIIGLVAAIIPWLYLDFRKKRRVNQFERQLPDALDMIGRALKAGHAFNGGIQMVVMEFADPARTEFRKTLDEINFGLSYEDALRNMTERIDCTDLKFFVLSVIIQRQSGGNLAEILEKISGLIRERFKLFGKVKALTGEARISAVILTILPFVIGGIIFLLNPAYIGILFQEKIGQIMLLGAVVMMIIGIYVMRRMVGIKV
jgi:tight adherence protein B